MGEPAAPADQGWLGPVRVVRSRERRSTVTARVVDGVMELRVPARLTREEEQYWVARLGRRLARRSRRPGDPDLEARASQLNREYFAGRLSWTSVAFSPSQVRRWGSCSTVDGTVRIAQRARDLPDWVLDYLLVHELAHLEVPGHGERFWTLVNRYPLTERARGYLMALDHQAGRDGQEDF
jgi:predicted metal-dependent hydrolase